MTLDDEEAEIALMALQHLRADANNQRTGNQVMQVGGAAHRCCGYVISKCDALICRIQQYKQDLAEEQADA